MWSSQLGWHCEGEPGPLSARGLPVPLSSLGGDGRLLPTPKDAGGVHSEQGNLSYLDDFKGPGGGIRAAPPPWVRGLLGDHRSSILGMKRLEGRTEGERGLTISGNLVGRCTPCLFVELLAD